MDALGGSAGASATESSSEGMHAPPQAQQRLASAAGSPAAAKEAPAPAPAPLSEAEEMLQQFGALERAGLVHAQAMRAEEARIESGQQVGRCRSPSIGQMWPGLGQMWAGSRADVGRVSGRCGLRTA
jgi:hypothetical protein